MPIKPRYQNNNFKKKLQTARKFKRQAQTPSAGSARATIKRLYAFAPVAVLIALALYLLLFPNHFTISGVEVAGLKLADRLAAEKQAREYLGKEWPLPLKNWLLVSGVGLVEHLEGKNHAIKSVESVGFKAGILRIVAVPRKAAYLARAASGVFVVSSDGAVLSAASGSESSRLAGLEGLENHNLVVGQQAIKPDLARELEVLTKDFENLSGDKVAKISLPSAQDPDMAASFKSGFGVKLDSKGDLKKAARNLERLLKEFPSGQLSSLSYIDLRLDDKAYVCRLGQPCAALGQVSGAATSSPASRQ